MTQQAALERDASRYRFLRTLASRDHANNTKRAMTVGIIDWGKKLGGSGLNCWSVREVVETDMDRAVDRLRHSRKYKNENTNDSQ